MNKFTKAELINKYKTLEQKVKNKTDNNTLLAKLLLFKSIILKISLIALLIKTFRKYSFIRKIWSVLNLIIVSIFGISVMDIYGVSFFSNILDTLRSTYVYSWFFGLLDTNVNSVEQVPSRLKTINQTSTGNEKSSGLTEGFKRLIIKEEPKIDEDETPLYKNKWVIIGLILLLAGLTWWYFGDDIKPFFPGAGGDGGNISRRKRLFYNEKTKQIEEVPNAPVNLPNVPTQDPTVERTWIDAFKDFFDISKWKSKASVNDQPNVVFDAGAQSDVELENRINKLKGNTPVNKSDSPEEVDSINYYFDDKTVEQTTDLTGNELLANLENQRQQTGIKIMEHLTGEANNKFDLESNELIGQINTFLDYHDTELFPSDTIKSGMYQSIKSKIIALSILNSVRYKNWVERTDVSSNILRFFNLEPTMKSIDEQSDTYNEIANATIKEQEAWSDDGTRASTPKLEELEVIKPETPKSTSKPLEVVSNFKNRIEETKTKFSDLFNSISLKQKDVETNLEQPVASSSKTKLEDLPTNNKLEPNLYQETLVENNKPIFSSLLDQIKSKRNDENVIDDLVKETKPLIEPNVSENSNSSLDRYFPEKSPEIVITPEQNIDNVQKPENKSLFNNLFDQINKLRKSPKLESTDNTNIENPVDASLENTTLINEENVNDDVGKNIGLFTNLFKDIKSKRIEYGTPISKDQPLETDVNILTNNPIVTKTPIENYPDPLNLFDDTNELFDTEGIEEHIDLEKTPQEGGNTSSSDEIIDSWDKIKVNIWDKSKQINITFDRLWNEVHSVHFATNDNHLSVFDFEDLGKTGDQVKVSDTFCWDRRLVLKDDNFKSELKEVIIKDLNGDTHSIYRNEKYFK